MARWTNEDTWLIAIQRAADRYNVPPELIQAIIGQESGFRPTAYRSEPAIQDASIGLMQILYATAKGEGYTGPVGDAQRMTGLYEPATNIMFGTAFLETQLVRAQGHIPSAVSAYNGGWRPDIGFGAIMTRPITICLARDTTGKCIRSRNVPVGEYSNQPYVDAVIANYQYFLSKKPVAPTATAPPILAGVSPPPLANAHHNNDESKIGGHPGGTLTRIVRTPVRETVMKRIFSIAAGKKWVSMIGLAVTALGMLCLNQREELEAIISDVWAGKLCASVTVIGGIMASLGQGLADKRQPRANGYYAASRKDG